MRPLSYEEASSWAKAAYDLAVSDGVRRFNTNTLRIYLRKLDGCPMLSEKTLERFGVKVGDFLDGLKSGILPDPTKGLQTGEPPPPEVSFKPEDLVEIGDGVKATKKAEYEWEQGFAKLLDAHEERKRTQAEEVYRGISIEVDRPDEPIVVLTLGDMHFGSPNVDYPRLLRVLELLHAKHIKVFAIFVGDVCDQMIWPGMRIEGRSSPLSVHKEILTAVGWMKTAHKFGRIIGGVCGNHDLFSEKMAGLSYFLMQLEQTKIPFAKHEMCLDLRVKSSAGEQSYKWEIRHAAQGSSIYQRAAGPVKHQRNNHRDTEILVTGHLHKSAYYNEERHGKTRWSIQVGSYKNSDLDEWAVEKGFERGDNEPDFGVFLWPNEHRIEVMRTRTSIEFLEALAVQAKHVRRVPRSSGSVARSRRK